MSTTNSTNTKSSTESSTVPSESWLEAQEEWTCTDPDTGQWVRNDGDGVFEVIELWKNVDGVSSYRGRYDVNQLTVGDLEEVISGYYSSISEVMEHYGSYHGKNQIVGWKQVVAEIMSEKKFQQKGTRS